MENAQRTAFDVVARLLKPVVFAYLLFVVVAAAAIALLADRWWPVTVLLFSPRWVLGLPLLALVPLALLVRRWLLLPLGAAVVVIVGPIMGFNLPAPEAFLHRNAPRDLRIMSYNIGGGSTTVEPAVLLRLIDQISPDVAAFQECNIDIDLFMAAGWYGHSDSNLCLVSRFPIRSVIERDRADIPPEHGSGAATEYNLDTPRGPLRIVNTHLATVRHGLSEVLHRAWRGAPALTANIALRRLESRVVRDFATRAAPAQIICGDFNIPVDSTIYGEFWSGWKNAFSRAGLGFGWSKFTRWHGIRIDQILLGDAWDARRVYAGPTVGFDHRAVVADLIRVDGR